MQKCLVIILISLLLTACNKVDNNQKINDEPQTRLKLKYATGFSVTPMDNAKLVEVLYPFQGATSGYSYLLVPRGERIPEHTKDTKVIYTPINSIACTSTTHIPLLEYLGEGKKLTGFTSNDYISSEAMRKRIDAGQITELGVDNGINIERLAVLNPDLLMGYTMTADYGQFRKIEALGVPVVINAEYLEKHPLGRAEWIRFMALFFHKEKQADSIFLSIEKNYLETKALVDTVSHRPTVVSGVVYGDAWFLPGGENYASRIIRDSGCHYLWEDDRSNGFLQLPFEAVYNKAHNADLWIGTATYRSLKEIAAADERYTKFQPFVTKNVFNYDARQGAKGGSEFMELGYLRPDIILKDLVKIAHPELLPNHELYFHRRLPD